MPVSMSTGRSEVGKLACNNYGGKHQGFTCSNSAILLLQIGDVVYVEDHLAAATIRGLYSDFSGAKLN